MRLLLDWKRWKWEGVGSCTKAKEQADDLRFELCGYSVLDSIYHQIIIIRYHTQHVQSRRDLKLDILAFRSIKLSRIPLHHTQGSSRQSPITSHQSSATKRASLARLQLPSQPHGLRTVHSTAPQVPKFNWRLWIFNFNFNFDFDFSRLHGTLTGHRVAGGKRFVTWCSLFLCEFLRICRTCVY